MFKWLFSTENMLPKGAVLGVIGLAMVCKIPVDHAITFSDTITILPTVILAVANFLMITGAYHSTNHYHNI